MNLWPFTGKPKVMKTQAAPWPLELPLLPLGNGEQFTLDDSFRGSAVLGATGSGKTSTICHELALAFLKNGFGGIVPSVKDERERWKMLARAAGREDDLIIVDERCEYTLNPFEYEMARTGRGGGSVINVSSLLSTLVSCKTRGTGDRKATRENEGYWENASQELLRAVISLLHLAGAPASLDLISEVIHSAPRSLDEVASLHWRTSSRCCALMHQADQAADTAAKQRELVLVLEYFLKSFPTMPDATRGSVVSTYTATADVLRHGLMHELLGKGTTLDPRVTEEGKVILVDLPILQFGVQGLLANAIFLYCWKRSIERRDVRRSPRPNFFFSDEFHHLCVADDSLFFSTCRSSRVACVVASQGVANYRVALGGGEIGRETTDAMLNNLCHKWFMCNSCPASNAYASSLCGEHRDVMFNESESHALNEWPVELFGSGDGQTTRGYSESVQPEVRPEEFQRLRTGGPTNGFVADCILSRSGSPFSDTGKVWRRLRFKQSWLPGRKA